MRVFLKCQNLMRVLLSIKPEFAEKIFEGTKQYEFRRILFKNPKVHTVIVYASAPVSKIVGEFTVEEVLSGGVTDLWNKTKRYAGVSEDYYHGYFKGKNEGFAIKIKDPKKYSLPVSIQDTFGIRPPQSFQYLP